MISDWTHHLKDPEEKARFKKYLLGSRGVLDRQSDILKRMEEDLTSSELNESVYDSPAWGALQADINGQRRMLRKIQKLINLDQKEN